MVATYVKSTLQLKLNGKNKLDIISTGLDFTNKTIEFNAEMQESKSDGRDILEYHTIQGNKWVEVEKWKWGTLEKSVKYVRDIIDGKLLEVSIFVKYRKQKLSVLI